MALNGSGTALGVLGAGERSSGARRVLPRPVLRPGTRVMDRLAVILPVVAFLASSAGVVALFDVVSGA